MVFRIRSRTQLVVFAVVMFVAGIGTQRLIRSWQPERYVPAKFDTFIGRVEANRWSMAGWIVADSYSDRWGFNKESLVDSGRSVFRHFQWIEIRRGEESWEFSSDSATVTVTLELRGDGTQVAAMARDTAAEATEPFVFTLRKTGFMPWNWQIVSIDQPQLRIGPGQRFF